MSGTIERMSTMNNHEKIQRIVKGWNIDDIEGYIEQAGFYVATKTEDTIYAVTDMGNGYGVYFHK